MSSEKAKKLGEMWDIALRDAKKYHVSILLFGPGEESETFKLRKKSKQFLSNHPLVKNVKFPEDYSKSELKESSIKKGKDLLAEGRPNQVELVKEMGKSFGKQPTLKEYYLMRVYDLVFFLLTSPGTISEFSQFYPIEKVNHKFHVFIWLKHYESDSYITQGPLNIFESKFNRVYPFECRKELFKTFVEVLNAEVIYKQSMNW